MPICARIATEKRPRQSKVVGNGRERGVTLMDGLSGLSQLDRIERKLDALIEALAEEPDDQEETVEVVTMDGQRYTAPVNPKGFL